MITIPNKTLNKMVEVIKTISEQSKDNPQMVKSLFGFSIVNTCNEVQEELKTKETNQCTDTTNQELHSLIK